MLQLADCSPGASRISRLLNLASSLNHKLTKLFSGKNFEEQASWSGYDMAIDEAIYKAEEEANFISDQESLGLVGEKGISQFIKDLFGVGDSRHPASQREK